MKKLTISIFILLNTALGEEPLFLKFDTSLEETSDSLEINQYQFSFRNNRRDLHWKYPKSISKAFDYGFDITKYTGKIDGSFDGTKLVAHIGRKWSDKSLTTVKLGAHQYEIDDSETTIGSYELKQSFIVKESFWGDIGLDYDFLYPQQGIPGPFHKKTKRTRVKLKTQYSFYQNFRAPFELSYLDIQDGNKSTKSSLSILYGRAYPIWVWLGYGFETLSYKERVSDYWSPEKFRAHGPRFEIAKNVYGKLSLKFSYNYSIIKEEDYESGKASYISTALEYGKRDDYLLSLGTYKNTSEQLGNKWWSKGLSLSFQKSL